MDHLRPAQLAQIEATLRLWTRDLHDDICRELMQSADARHRAVADRVGDGGDRSVTLLLADLDTAAVDHDVRKLCLVEAARERLKAGTYGGCLDCGVAIPLLRLLGQPHAARCVSCAQRHERACTCEATSEV